MFSAGGPVCCGGGGPTCDTATLWPFPSHEILAAPERWAPVLEPTANVAWPDPVLDALDVSVTNEAVPIEAVQPQFAPVVTFTEKPPALEVRGTSVGDTE